MDRKKEIMRKNEGVDGEKQKRKRNSKFKS